MPKYIATRPILAGKPGKRIEEGEPCDDLNKQETEGLLKKGAIVTLTEWKKRQLPAAAQESLEAALKRAEEAEAEAEALRSQVEGLEAQVAKLTKAVDDAKKGKKADDGGGNLV